MAGLAFRVGVERKRGLRLPGLVVGRHAVALAVLTGVFVAVAGARAQQPQTSAGGPLETWLQAATDPRGQHCTAHAQREYEKHVLIACGQTGLWEVALDGPHGPRLVQIHEVGGEAVGFFEEADGRVWVKIRLLQARPLDALVKPPVGTASPPPTVGAMPPLTAEGASPQPSAAPSPPARPPRAARGGRRVGRVVASNPGEVVISLGAADGLEPGMRVKLSVQSQEPFGAGESVVSTERVAVGTVTGVSEHHAKVELGLNESAPVGALAERTRAPATTALTTPPRVTGIWEAQLMGRPFVAIEELGGGIVASASIGRRFDGNLHLRALLDPFAFADAKRQEGSTSEKPSLVTASGVFIASYDSQFLEMGAGIGAQTVSELGEPGSGLAVAQVMRLGALDGLHLDVRSTIVLFRSEFAFGTLAITARIPVSRRYWVVLGGGGGVTGHGYGELGLRVLLGGNGGRGSTFLTATAGGAGVFKSSYCTEVNFSFDCTEHVMYAGPMVGAGMEWRF